MRANRFFTLVAFCVAAAGCGSEPSAPRTTASAGSHSPRVLRIPSGRYYGIAEPGAKVSMKFDSYHPTQEYLGVTGSLAFGPNEIIVLSGFYAVSTGSLRLSGNGWTLLGANGYLGGAVSYNGAASGSWNAASQSSGDSVLVVLGGGQDPNHSAVRVGFYIARGNVSGFLAGDSQSVSLSGRYDSVNRIVRFQSGGTAAGSAWVRGDGFVQGSYDVAGFGKGSWTGSVR